MSEISKKSCVSPKILGFIDEDPFDSKTWSGSSRYFFNALEAAGVLEGALSADCSSRRRLFAKLKNIDIDLEKWKFKYRLDTSLFSAMTETALEKIKGSGDFNTILQVGAWYDLYRADKSNISYHDGNLQTRLSSPFGYPKINQKYIQRALDYEKSVYEKMDVIFPMSEWLGRSFAGDFGIDSSRICAVGAGINLARVNESENRSYDGKTILFVGKNFERKGGACLLEAFTIVRKKLPKARLRIIGPHLANIPDGVHCLGYVDKSSEGGLDFLLDEYMRASVFVLPSLYEPFGIAFVEAMAHRLPCIGTNICAMPEIISDGESGFLVDPNDESQLASRMLELLTNEQLCRRFGEIGYDSYREKYNWPAVSKKIITRTAMIQLE